MAVLGRVLISSAERWDLPDVLSIESYAAGDWKYFMKTLVGDDRPYILKGFDVIDPGQCIGTTSLSVRVADSAVYYPNSAAGSFFYGLSEGNELSQPLVPELRKNATNYVYLTLTTQDAAQDTRSFWDPDKDGGTGGEFTQDVNTESVLVVNINASVSSFPSNTIPVCKVVMGPNFIESIEDARDNFFRLGSGGMNVDPNNRYNFKSLPSLAYTRNEPSTKISNSLSPNPFQGGDKNIHSLKEWMDVVMTKLAELGGTTYWYEDSSAYNAVNLFFDTVGSSIRSKGKWSHDLNTPGLVAWTDDIIYQSLLDSRDYIIRSGSKTLLDQQVLYVNLDRNSNVNDNSISIDWFTGVNYVNAAIGGFSNLMKGDWIKKIDDSGSMFVRVEQFYAGTNLGGGVTVPGSARSVKLSAPYVGTTESKIATYSRGIYTNSDLQVGARGDSNIIAAGGNMYWLAYRSDSIQNIQSIVNTNLNIDITNHDGSVATCREVSYAPHGLIDGQLIGIRNSANFNGIYSVVKESDTVFYINKKGTVLPDESGVICGYATITTAPRYNADGTIQLESANHGFNSGKKVTINGVSSWDNTYPIFVDKSWSTTFTIPVTTAVADYIYSSGSKPTATLPLVTVRTELNPVKVEQGEIKYIGDADTDNLKKYIGIADPAQTIPEYNFIQNSDTKRHTLYGFEDYFNLDNTDSLTERIARHSALLADKAQDKLIKFGADFSYVTNTVNAIDNAKQDIIFYKLSGTPSLKINVPGSNSGVSVSLQGTLTLAANSSAYIVINRNAPTVINSINAEIQSESNLYDLDKIIICDTKNVPIDENVLLIAYRLSDEIVYLWDQSKLNKGNNYPADAVSSLIEDKNVILSIVGGIEFNSSTGTLQWSNDINIVIPNKLFDFKIPAGSFSGLADTDILYVKFDRTGTNIELAAQSVADGMLSFDIDNYVIGYRRGDNFVLRNGQVVSRIWVYEESAFIDSQINPGDDIALPLDSRNGNATKIYRNGRGEIEFFINDIPQDRNQVILSAIFTPNSYSDITGFISVPDIIDLSNVSRGDYFKDSLNNEFFIVGGVNDTIGSKGFLIAPGLTPDLGSGLIFRQDFAESGSTGSWVSSIIAKKIIPAGSILKFRVIPISTLGGGSASGGGGSGGSGGLQDGYNNGRTIMTTAGNPFEVSGPAGQKIAKFNGDIFVAGVLDPKGVTFIPQATNPAPTSNTLWMKNDGTLMFSTTSTGDTPINGGGSSTIETGSYTNNSGAILQKGRVVRKSGAITMAYADWSSFYNAAVIGITLDNVLNNATGSFQRYGRVTEGILTVDSFVEGSLPTDGDWIYLSADSGKLTITPPVQGSGNKQIYMGTWDNGSLNLNITPWGTA